MNKRHYEHTLPNIRGSLSNTYMQHMLMAAFSFIQYHINLSYKLAVDTKLVNMNDIRLLL